MLNDRELTATNTVKPLSEVPHDQWMTKAMVFYRMRVTSQILTLAREGNTQAILATSIATALEQTFPKPTEEKVLDQQATETAGAIKVLFVSVKFLFTKDTRTKIRLR